MQDLNAALRTFRSFFGFVLFLASCPLPSHLVLLGSSICRGSGVLAAPAGVPLIPAGGHLLGRPLSEHLVQVEPAPVAHEERADLCRRLGSDHLSNGSEVFAVATDGCGEGGANWSSDYFLHRMLWATSQFGCSPQWRRKNQPAACCHTAIMEAALFNTNLLVSWEFAHFIVHII